MIYINLLIIFIAIIFVHELGHYTFARIFRTTVTDFSIGFGKVLYEFKDKNLTKWKISLFPLGGYVKIKGLESIFSSNITLDKSKDSFQSLSLYKKIIILFAGSFFNIVSSWVVLFFILFFFGIVNFSSEIGNVLPNSPAEKNDLRSGDIIINVNGNEIKSFIEISKAIEKKKRIKLDIIKK